MIVSSELGGTWKESVIAYLKVTFQISSEGTEGKRDKIDSDLVKIRIAHLPNTSQKHYCLKLLAELITLKVNILNT